LIARPADGVIKFIINNIKICSDDTKIGFKVVVWILLIQDAAQ
jgi:hypothetical protein